MKLRKKIGFIFGLILLAFQLIWSMVRVGKHATITLDNFQNEAKDISNLKSSHIEEFLQYGK